MIKVSGKVLILAGALTVAALATGIYFLQLSVPKPGILEGTVIIGPLCPVEPCEVPPEVRAQAYGARKVLVTAGNPPVVIKVLDLNPLGHFMASLPPGTYTVDINRIGMDRSPDVPTTVEIRPGGRIALAISIDTGIR